MYCRKCGKELSDDALFCKYCGEKIKIQENPNSGNKLSGIHTVDIVSKFPIDKVGKKGVVILCVIIFVIAACINAFDYYGWPFSINLKEVNVEGFNSTLTMLSPVKMEEQRLDNPGPNIKRYVYKIGNDKNYICEAGAIELVNSDEEFSEADALRSMAKELKKKTTNFYSGKYEKVNIGKLKGTKLNMTFTEGIDEYKARSVAFRKNNIIWCVYIGYRASLNYGDRISEQVIESIKISPKQ